MQPQLLRAHRDRYAAIKSGPGKFPVGVNIAIIDNQAVGADSQRDVKRQECYAAWLEAAAHSDYVGVQTYGRSLIGKDGPLPARAGAELTQMGEGFYPQGLENTIHYAAAATRKPVFVTENGIATEDDTRRVAYIKAAVQGVARCISDGIDVRTYIHWSLLDNFEWLFGYRLKFGLVAVDRKTQVRTPKPSAGILGAMARAGYEVMVLFINARIFDGTGAAPYPGAVLVKDNRIAAIARADASRLSRDAVRVIDAEGATLMPGMTESHAHLSRPSSVERFVPGMHLPEEDLLLNTARNARILLDHGFTSVYSAGALGKTFEMSLKAQIDS